MKRKGTHFRSKERKLLQLYSLWQETRHEELRRECLGLLGEILRLRPGFRLRERFETAF